MPRDTSQTPFDLKRVPNCQALTVCRIPREGLYKPGSTQVEGVCNAITRAKEIWIEHYTTREKMIPREKRVEHLIKQLQVEQEKKVARGIRNPRFAKVDGHRFAALQEFFKDDAIDAIDGQRIQDFQGHLYEQNPGISKAAVRHYFVALRKILKQAVRSGSIQSLPQFPDVGGASGINPRTGFSVDEYKKLRERLKKKVAEDTQYAEVYDLVLFLANSLLRPSEVKHLTHHSVRLGKDKVDTTLFV